MGRLHPLCTFSYFYDRVLKKKVCGGHRLDLPLQLDGSACHLGTVRLQQVQPPHWLAGSRADGLENFHLFIFVCKDRRRSLSRWPSHADCARVSTESSHCPATVRIFRQALRQQTFICFIL